MEGKEDEIELNMIILEAIKMIAAKSKGKISYEMKTITENRNILKKSLIEKTFINIELTKSL